MSVVSQELLALVGLRQEDGKLKTLPQNKKNKEPESSVARGASELPLGISLGQISSAIPWPSPPVPHTEVADAQTPHILETQKRVTIRDQVHRQLPSKRLGQQ